MHPRFLLAAILPNLWVIHPFWTKLVAVVLAVTILLSLFQATKGILEIIVAAKRDRRRSLISLALAVTLVGVLFGAASWVFNELTRPRPIITSKTGKVLSPDYSIEWSYGDEQNGTVTYFVTITDKETGDTITPRQELLPNARLAQPGNMLVQIEAVGADSSRVTSDVAEIDWYRDSLERIQKTGELVVGVHADNTEGLFCFRQHNIAGGIGYDGFDIDLIQQIKKYLETSLNLKPLKLKLIFVPWPEIIERPNQFDVDFAIASISITKDRQEKVLFSEPYWESKIAILQSRNSVPEPDRLKMFGFANFDSKDPRKAEVIGVHRETTEVAFVKDLIDKGSTVRYKEARNNTELFSMLQNSEVTGIVYDSDRAWTELKLHPNWIARDDDYDDLHQHNVSLLPEKYGIVFAKVNERLWNQINPLLRQLHDNGWIGKTFKERKDKLQKP